MCTCNFACKVCPRNDLYCVSQDVKPCSLTHCSYYNYYHCYHYYCLGRIIYEAGEAEDSGPVA